MYPKKLIGKFMFVLKNAKLNADLHKKMKVFAAENGLQISAVIDAACLLALAKPEKLRQLAEEHTKQVEQKVGDK